MAEISGTFKDLMEFLKDDPTEAKLADVYDRYNRIDLSWEGENEKFYVGFFLVEVEEGLVFLPYTDVIGSSVAGYEQFDLEAAYIIPPEGEVFEEVYSNVMLHLDAAHEAKDKLDRHKWRVLR